MKALKEKRIRLRSLWRRGLVILSLFALVFVSCNSSDGGEEETTPPPPDKNAVNIEYSWSLPKQYEGTAFDFGSSKITLTYNNGYGKLELTKAGTGKGDKISDYFRVEPAYIQGVILEDTNDGKLVWAPIVNYTLYWNPEGGSGTVLRDIPAVTVVPIQRKLNTGNTSLEIAPVTGLYSAGTAGYYGTGDTSLFGFTGEQFYFNTYQLPPLKDRYVSNATINFVGDLDLLEAGVYVDDPALDTILKGSKDGNKGFRLQATYTDLNNKEIPLENVDARFVTYYDSTHNVTAGGALLATLKTNGTVDSRTLANAKALIGASSFINGLHYEADDLDASTWNARTEGKLTGILNIPKVFHVQEVEVINTQPYFDDETNGLFMYYWEGATDFAGNQATTDLWYGKLAAAGAKLKVTYTGGPDNPREISLAQAASSSNIVWYNQNQFYKGDGDAAETEYAPYQPFGISGVTKTAEQAKSEGYLKNSAWDKLVGAYTGPAKLSDGYPAIRVEYRGAVAEVSVDIVNKVTEFNVIGFQPGKEPEGGFDMMFKRQSLNDDLGPLGGPDWDQVKFGNILDLSLTLTSVRDKTRTWFQADSDDPNNPNKVLTPVAATTDAESKGGAPGSPYNFTSTFGPVGSFRNNSTDPEPDLGASMNWSFVPADWGVSGKGKDGSKNITVWYQPPDVPTGLTAAQYGKITNKLIRGTITAEFKNIGKRSYYAQ